MMAVVVAPEASVHRRISRRRLRELIGGEKADALMGMFAGHKIPEPNDADAARAERNQRLRAMLDGGATYREAAAQFGVSERMAKSIAKGD